MKALVIYYSRSSITKKIAQTISEKNNADIEEIVDTQQRGGIIGFIKSGFQAVYDKLTKIEDIKSNLDDYDLVILGTPVWAGKPSTPATTFIKKYHTKIKNLAVFITHANSNNSYQSAIDFIENAAGKKAIKTLSVPSNIIKNNDFSDVVSFANDLIKL
jgi:menaquinone-dependent protoporphyrinogen IX oxidase